MKRNSLNLLLVFLLAGWGTLATAQSSGGIFQVTDAVVASGGGSASGVNVDLEGTTGQSIAGGAIGAGGFSVTAGFWTYSPVAPTAAFVSISGRVLSPTGAVRNAVVYLQTEDGNYLMARTTTFGYYRFQGIVAGQTVFITVLSKEYRFNPRVITVFDEITDLDIFPEP